MLKNWLIVYLGNAAGSILAAAGCVYGGQLNYSGGELAVFTMRLAAGKCSLGTGSAVILGVLCNVLVTTGVLLALSAKDLPGRVMGAYLPVAFFVICGFEHCVANMFYFTVAGAWSGKTVLYLIVMTLGNALGGVLFPAAKKFRARAEG